MKYIVCHNHAATAVDAVSVYDAYRQAYSISARKFWEAQTSLPSDEVLSHVKQEQGYINKIVDDHSLKTYESKFLEDEDRVYVASHSVGGLEGLFE